MKLLFIGGQLDGRLQDVDQTISPLVPVSITATLPDGTKAQYHVDFFQGAKTQFPLAVLEGLDADDVFKMLLRWYVAKPMVKVIPKEQSDPSAEPSAEPPAEPSAKPSSGNIIVP